METRFAFLERLEGELTEVAKAEARRMAVPPPRRHRSWRPWIAAAATLLVVAFSLGAIVYGSNVKEAAMTESRPAAALGSVGSSVDSPGGKDHLGFLPGTTPGTGGFSAQGNDDGAGKPAQQTDLSKIIRDGEIALTIDAGSFRERAAAVAKVAGSNGGSILSSSTNGGDSGSFTLRIPAANFDRAMTQLAVLGDVDSSESHGQDVTAQYVDLKAHSKIYRSRRKVLFGLMQQATTIEQTITLQNQLDEVQLKIDQIQGQLNYINKQVAESTIKVDLHEPGAVVQESPAAEIDNPSLGRAWDHAVQGFLNVLAAVVIGLGYLIPLLVGLGYLLWRSVQRRRPDADDAG